MNRYNEYLKNIDYLNMKLRNIQYSFLMLEKKESTAEFEKIFNDYDKKISSFKENFENAQKPDKEYLIKNQCRLLLRFLNKLKVENESYTKKNEAEIIQNFEQQIRFKKIILKHLATIKSLD